MPSLSLIIPSYKRFDVLKKNINHIDSLEIPANLEVEFIVAANTNSDKYNFLPKNSRFKLHPFNDYKEIGENIYRSYKLGTKEYVYVLGDDDILSPYFFYAIAKYLDKDYICIHFQACHGYGNDIVNFNTIKYEDKGVFSEYVMPFKELIYNHNLDLGFISSVIIKNDIIKENLQIDKKLIGYEFLAPLFLNIKFQNNLSCYISAPLIVERKDVNRSYNNKWPLIFLYGAYNFIQKIGDVYNLDTHKIIEKRYNFSKILYNLLWFSSTKNTIKDITLFKTHLPSHYKNFLSILIFLPTKFIFKLIRKFIYFLKNE